MGHSRLNNLMFIHIHQDRTDHMDLKLVANDFIKNKEELDKLYLYVYKITYRFIWINYYGLNFCHNYFVQQKLLVANYRPSIFFAFLYGKENSFSNSFSVSSRFIRLQITSFHILLTLVRKYIYFMQSPYGL